LFVVLDIKVFWFNLKMAKTLNFNVGVLGHVDSGKTSLSKALSTVASTACFDKNPQSKERGITLDLGFSSFVIDLKEKPNELQDYHSIQYTLVDCPGHASLIRTIIGGAQIIDLMLLVIDVTKGLQTQTAECLIIGEITCHKMIVVLNKIDMLQPDKQAGSIEKMKKRMWKTLETTKFANCPIVSVAAKPGGPDAQDVAAQGIQDLISTLQQNTYLPSRSDAGDFVFSADHCFSIRGQGTVMTGTVLSGSVKINDTVDIPSLGLSKKVKSMQMFRKPVERIKQGDRAGICVTQFDPTQLERGLVCTPQALVTVEAILVHAHKIAYYKAQILTKSKYHITVGHETVMGRISIFSSPFKIDETDTAAKESCFDFSRQYDYQDELKLPLRQGSGDEDSKPVGDQFMLIELERPITCQPLSLIIGSRLDADIHTSACRIAFHGKILVPMTDTKYKETILPKVKVFKVKTKEGQVERATDQYTIIGKNLFKKETNLAAFANLKISLSTGEKGVIEGGFGQSGKVKIRIPEGLSAETYKRYSGSGKKKGKGKDDLSEGAGIDSLSVSEPVKIFLHFKRFMYDPNKTMIQS